MARGTLAIIASLGGVEISIQAVRESDHPNPYEVVLPAAKAVSAWAKADADEGGGTLAAGHGLVTGDRVDVYWQGGLRYGMTATVAVNAVTVLGGEGDDLPESADASVLLAKRVQINADIQGNVAVMAIAGVSPAGARAHVEFQAADQSMVAARELTPDSPLVWTAGSGDCPLAGDPITRALATAGVAYAVTLKVATLEDRTP
jgi:hypothetical protein